MPAVARSDAGAPAASDAGAPRIVLIHGAATTAAVWRDLAARLSGEFDVATPQRRSTGDWELELDDLADVCTGAIVVGVSGGATLGLELVLRGVEVAGAVLHEPAAGSLSPHLLDPMLAALREGGPAAFGTALYGPSWTAAMLPADPGAVARDLAMFRAFEPRPADHQLAEVLLTVGGLSPAIRHESVRAVAQVVGARTATISGARHAVHLDSVAAFADAVASHAATLQSRALHPDAAVRSARKGD